MVVPCYNEQSQIKSVLSTIPEEADIIYAVDDASGDDTAKIISEQAAKDSRVILVKHSVNQGVGAAIMTGYRRALQDGYDIVVIMAGDGQMDPSDFEAVVKPVADGVADYCKGNRFLYRDGMQKIPNIRLFGNFTLSALTKIVSGYWTVSDTQCGYTAINSAALSHLVNCHVYPRYGVPNDILTKLNIVDMRVTEARVNPLYGVGEKSKMKVTYVILPILMLLIRLFFERMTKKYAIRLGHPLVLSYLFGMIFGLATVLLSLYIFIMFLMTTYIMKAALITTGVCAILSVQFILSAFSMDYESNKSLCVISDHPSLDRQEVTRDHL